jgi:hypothetical protein
MSSFDQQPTDRKMTNTEFERLALSSPINLSDGHARLPLDSIQRSIIADSIMYHDMVSRNTQEDVEKAFLTAFFSCAQQSF